VNVLLLLCSGPGQRERVNRALIPSTIRVVASSAVVNGPRTSSHVTQRAPRDVRDGVEARRPMTSAGRQGAVPVMQIPQGNGTRSKILARRSRR
jgi:hypothetical protein